MNETGLSARVVSNFIKVNPFVALIIECQSIEFLKEND